MDGLVGQLGFKGDVWYSTTCLRYLMTTDRYSHLRRGVTDNSRLNKCRCSWYGRGQDDQARSDSMPVEGEEPWSIEEASPSELRGALKDRSGGNVDLLSTLTRSGTTAEPQADRFTGSPAALEQVMDLLDSWDDDKDGQIRLREWLVHLKKFCELQEVEVWYDVVRASVTDAFEGAPICAAH